MIRTLRHLKEDSEWTWYHKDGTRFFVQVSVSSITHPNGELKGFVFIARDISDIKESNESRERLLTIVESARDSILSFDERGYIFYMNQAGKSAVGLDKRQTVGKHFSEYVDIQNDINFEEGLNTAIREGFWEFEAEVITKEQRQIFISVIIVPHFPQTKVSDISQPLREILRTKYIPKRSSFERSKKRMKLIWLKGYSWLV